MFYNQSYKDKTKKQLVEIGVEHVKRFMNLNRVPLPTFYLFPVRILMGIVVYVTLKEERLKFMYPTLQTFPSTLHPVAGSGLTPVIK